MKKLAALFLGLALLTAAGIACTKSSAVTGGTTTTVPTTVPTTLPADQQQAVDASKAKLAERLKVGVATITLVSIQAVDWPDTSLGVPEPGKMYAQVIVPGFKIMLSSSGTQYEYHTGKIGGTLTVVAK